jgi:hypothetical protein
VHSVCALAYKLFIYYLAMHIANSVLWIDAYHDLESLKPGGLITLAVLDFFLSWESHQSQHSGNSANHFYYLPTETVQKLTGDLNHDNILVRKCLGFESQPISDAPVIFLVTFTPNTYFLALFHFSKERCFILGKYRLQTLDVISVHAEWESWSGPTLWKRIGRAFNWLTSEGAEAQSMVVIYEASWIPVYSCIQLQ